MSTNLFLPLLGELLAKSAVLIVAAMLILAVWKRGSASTRHFVWCVTFAAILLLPATLLCRPTWAIPVIRVTSVASVERPTGRVTLADDPLPVGSTPAALPPRNSGWQWPDRRPALIATWVAGAGLVLLRRLIGSTRLYRLRRMSELCTDARLEKMLSELLPEQHVRRPVELRISERASVPMTWRTLRPVLLLPKGAMQWSDEYLTAALRHEIGHIARFDHLSRWMSLVACALYWPNPLVWVAARGFKIEQEKAADDVVLAAGTDADEYVGQLFEVARSIPTATQGIGRCAVAMATPSTLEQRMLAIVDEERDRRPLARRTFALGIVTAACSVGLSTAGSLLGEERSPAEPDNAKGPAIEIEAKFIEFSRPIKNDESALSLLIDDRERRVLTFGADKYAELTRMLSQRRGSDLISPPKVVTRSDQKASIEIGNEFRYATQWEQKEGKWVATKYDTQMVGVFLTCTPTVQKDGSIITEIEGGRTLFLGFRDLDALVDQDPQQPPRLNEALVPNPEQHEGRRMQAVFDTAKNTTSIQTLRGQTAVIRLPEIDVREEGQQIAPAGPNPRELVVFVTPRMQMEEKPTPPARGEVTLGTPSADERDPTLPLNLSAFGERFLGARPSAADGGSQSLPGLPAPGPPTSEFLIPLRTTVDGAGQQQTQPSLSKPTLSIHAEETRWSNGKAVAEGDVEIDTGTHIIRTDKAEIRSKPAAPSDRASAAILPRMEFREASLPEAVQFIARKAREVSGEELRVTVPDVSSEARITVSLRDIPVAEALNYVANLAGFTLARDNGRFLFMPQQVAKPSGAADASNVPSRSGKPAGVPVLGQIPGIAPLFTAPTRDALSEVTPPAAMVKKDEAALLISVIKGGRIQIGDQAVPADQLPKKLADMKRQTPGLLVEVSAEADVPYGEVQAVMGALQSADVTNVTFVKSPKAESKPE